MQTSQRRWRRAGPALGIVLLALALGATPVAAGDDHHGTYGVHALIDTEAYPAVTCDYPDAIINNIRAIRIRKPIVYGVDRTSGVDRQIVGWRYQIFASTPPDEDFLLVYTSPAAKATATDGYNAQWSNRRYTIPDPTAFHKYRVAIKMIWYWPSATQVEGSALHMPVQYRIRFADGSTSPGADHCDYSWG